MASSRQFDWWITGLSALFLGGLFLDGWAHNHLDTLDTFFTPWHAAFDGSFALLALFFGWHVWVGKRAGGSWSSAIPRGYEWSVLGILIFALSGLGDMLWHIRFGIEISTELLLSPTHLGLATGGALIVAGPFRAAVARGNSGAPATLWPAVLSLTFVLTLLTFMTQFAPALADWGMGSAPPKDLAEVRIDRSITVQLLQTVLLAGALLLALRQWGARLPVGTFTVMIGLNAAFMSTQLDYYPMLPAAIAAGVVCDVLYAVLRPSAERIVELRWFAFLVPFVYWAAHYADYLVRGQHVYYKIHIWAGLPVITGLIGLLLSFVAVTGQQAPRGAAEDTPA